MATNAIGLFQAPARSTARSPRRRYCIQRIRQARDHAKDDGRRRIRDGEVQPACVQTCPAEALVFGDRQDPDSQVSRSMNDPRAYRVLEELNTDPSVVYLKKVDADAG